MGFCGILALQSEDVKPLPGARLSESLHHSVPENSRIPVFTASKASTLPRCEESTTSIWTFA